MPPAYSRALDVMPLVSPHFPRIPCSFVSFPSGLFVFYLFSRSLCFAPIGWFLFFPLPKVTRRTQPDESLPFFSLTSPPFTPDSFTIAFAVEGTLELPQLLPFLLIARRGAIPFDGCCFPSFTPQGTKMNPSEWRPFLNFIVFYRGTSLVLFDGI